MEGGVEARHVEGAPALNAFGKNKAAAARQSLQGLAGLAQ
jgi:hypothetical protein